MRENRRLVTLILIMIAVVVAVEVATLAILFQTTLTRERARLVATARAQVALIEALADRVPDAAALIESQRQLRESGIGETGAIDVARRDGGRIVWLTPAPSWPAQQPSESLGPSAGEPMQAALDRGFGTMTGRDQSGRWVLAAYQPVPGSDLGVVARIDIGEIVRRYLRAATLATAASLVVAAGATWLTLRVSGPIIRRMHDNETRYRQLFDNMGVGVAVYAAVDGGADFVFRDFNRGAEASEKLERRDVIGRRLTEVYPRIREFGLVDVLARVWRSGEPEALPARLYRDDTREAWRENWVYRLQSGEVVALFDDVSERKLAEERNREREARFRGTFENAAVGGLQHARIEADRFFTGVAGGFAEFRIDVLNGAVGSGNDHRRRTLLDCLPQRPQVRLGTSPVGDLARIDRDLLDIPFRPANGIEPQVERSRPDLQVVVHHLAGFDHVTNGGQALRRLPRRQDRGEGCSQRIGTGTTAGEAVASGLVDGEDLPFGGDKQDLVPAGVEQRAHAQFALAQGVLGLLAETDVAHHGNDVERLAVFATLQGVGHVDPDDPAILVKAAFLERVGLALAADQFLELLDGDGPVQRMGDFVKPPPLQLLALIAENDTELLVEELPRAIQTEMRGHIWRGEFLNRKKNGKLFWELAAIAPVKDTTGRITHYVGVKEDISERKEMEEQLRQSQKMQALGQLTGGIAHDFNNLLAIITGNLELLDESLNGDSAPHELIEDALWSAHRGAELTHRLLAFARRQPLKPDVVDFNGIIRGLSDLLRRTLGGGIRVREDLAADLWPAYADRGELERALLNLAVNARDAMPRGGMLTLETRNATIDAAYAEQYDEFAAGDYVVLSVSDSGAGMAPDVVRHAFEPFFTTKEVGKGSGLGLSMVYGFVKQSGGHIEIDSHLARGTRVSLFLPRARDGRQPRQGGEVNPGVGQFHDRSVLLVEDEPKLRRVAAKMLGRLGLTIFQAESGEDALALLQQHRHVDLLFTDIELPGGMSGAELADRAQGLLPGIKILFTTGYARDAVLADPGKKEMPWLLKPYSQGALTRQLTALLAPDARTDPPQGGSSAGRA